MINQIILVGRLTKDPEIRYTADGAPVGVTGRIQTRSYENAEKIRVYVTEVVADSVRFMSGKPRELVEQEN